MRLPPETSVKEHLGTSVQKATSERAAEGCEQASDPRQRIFVVGEFTFVVPRDDMAE